MHPNLTEAMDKDPNLDITIEMTTTTWFVATIQSFQKTGPRFRAFAKDMPSALDALEERYTQYLKDKVT